MLPKVKNLPAPLEASVAAARRLRVEVAVEEAEVERLHKMSPSCFVN